MVGMAVRLSGVCERKTRSCPGEERQRDEDGKRRRAQSSRSFTQPKPPLHSAKLHLFPLCTVSPCLVPQFVLAPLYSQNNESLPTGSCRNNSLPSQTHNPAHSLFPSLLSLPVSSIMTLTRYQDCHYINPRLHKKIKEISKHDDGTLPLPINPPT